MTSSSQPARADDLLRDPVYYAAVVGFALLTTALPALLSAPWFLALAQTLSLWLLLLLPLRRNRLRPALWVIAIWVAVQAAVVLLLTLVAPGRLESAVGDGFRYGEGLLTWFYAGGPLPASWATQPWLRLLELAGVLLGALFTGGLVGVWFLVRVVNLFAFGAGALVLSGGAAGLFAGLQPWLLMRIAGYVLLLPLLALPGFTGDWWPGRWPARRRRLLWIGLGLVTAGILLELLLPGPWARLLSALVG